LNINCQRVIVAVDGGLDKVLPELSDKVSTKRLQILATEPADDVNFPMPVHREDDYWWQLPDGCIVLGGYRSI
jgi:gamma-glutamylputrescine oxidase